MNVDASFHQATGAAGLGGIFRDSSGIFLGDFTAYISSVSSASHGELLALLLGVREAHSHHFVPLVVETDCLVLVQALYSGSLESSELSFLLTDLRHALTAASAATLHHVKRSANKVAHLLAREAYVLGRDFEFFNVTPPMLEGALLSDCNDV